MEEITLDMAFRILNRAEDHVKKITIIPSSIAVVDQGGHLIAAYKMDGNYRRATIEVAINKARTAAIFAMPTKIFNWVVHPLGPANSLENAIQHQPQAAAIDGGVPIKNEIGDDVIGAVGASGGTADDDRGVAKAGAASLFELDSDIEEDEILAEEVEVEGKLSLTAVKVILKKAIDYARGKGKQGSIAIVDEVGWLVGFGRENKAPIGSINIAISKAWTAAAFKCLTSELSNWGNSNSPGYDLKAQNYNKNLTIIPGGLPIVVNNRVIGAIGVSCGSIKDDVEIGKVGASAVY